jgi:5'-3' exonuclease
MGIPYYFYSLTKKYQGILHSNKPNNTDIYCIDFNGIIHNVAQQVIKTYNDKNENICSEDNNIKEIEEKILEGLQNKIDEYIDTYKAKKYIICADGVAPMAKIIQQRKRRYLTIYRNKIDANHIKKPVWDTNSITPGTLFMNNMNNFINNKIRYSTRNIEYVYSGSNECGEGEHKIFNKLKNYSSNNEDIIINGLDADLIILSLISHIKNIHLMRETEDKLSKNIVYNYLNIDKLREAILKELKYVWELNDNDINNDNDIVESYCTLCSILGNDFIPHLLTIDIKTDGFDKLLNVAKKAIKENGLLVSNRTINYECLKYIFKYLSITEDKDIFNICDKYIKKNAFNTSQLPSDSYAIKNKSQLCHTIYNNSNNWHKEYYKVIFDNNITLDSSVIYNSCNNYIKGIYWVYEYYKGNDIDCEWYYPYNYPPTLKDISNYIIAYEQPVINKNNNFIEPAVQLLIVLPRESINLHSNKYKSFITDKYNGLYHMYPVNYEIQTFLKTHLWECAPILPLININYIKKIISMK